MKRDQGSQYRSAADNRTWAQRHRRGIAAGAVVVGIVAFVVLLGPAATLMYGPGLHKLTPDQQATAIDNFRGRLIQIGTVVLAAGVLFYTARNFTLSREGHVTERFTKAIEQLGSASLDVRLGAIYALERIMADSPRDHPTIVEVLAAYVREHAKLASREQRRSDHVAQGGSGVAPPYTDVQAVLTVLGRRLGGREERGRLNLQSTALAGADLTNALLVDANLTGADLSGASLTGANLDGAKLEGVDLTSAHLSGANLCQADLSNAKLARVLMDHAYLIGADLGSAELPHSVINHSDLAYADLTGATLTRVHLIGAILTDADLTSAKLTSADLTDANLTDADLTDAFLSAVKMAGAKLTRVNLTRTTWDNVDLTNVDLTDVDFTNALRTSQEY